MPPHIRILCYKPGSLARAEVRWIPTFLRCSHNFYYYTMNPRESQALFRGFFIFFLGHLEGGAKGLFCPACPIPGNANLCSRAVAVVIVDALYRLTVHRQAAFRCFKNVLKKTALVLIETSAAGLLFFLCIVPIHHDGLFAAAVIRIVKTACYIAL